MATDDKLIVHPGDIIQSTRDDWSRSHLFLVESTHSWGVGANIRWPEDGEERVVYHRFKPGQFAVVGAAALLPPDVAAARRDSLTTARAVAKEQVK